MQDDVAPVFEGPWDATPHALSSASTVDQLHRKRIRLHAAEAVPAGERVRWDKDRGRNIPLAAYLIVPVAARLLLVEAAPGTAGGAQTFVGSAKPIGSEVGTRLFGNDPIGGSLLSYELDTTEGTTGAWVSLLLLIAAAAWSIGRVKLAVERRSDPHRHPIVKRLTAYGEPVKLVRDLDAELADEPSAKLLGAQLVSSFLIHRTLFDTVILPERGLIWAYQKVTKKSVNFIPTGKDYHLVIHGAHGELIELQGGKEPVEQGLRTFYENFPWVPVGYNADRAAILAKAESRGEWSRAVEVRRREWVNQAVRKSEGR